MTQEQKIAKAEAMYLMRDTPIGGQLLLTGDYNYDSTIGWTMIHHIRKLTRTMRVVSHTIHGHDLQQQYSVIMEPK